MSAAEKGLKKDIVDCSISLHRRGLTTGLGGNVSARIAGSGEVWITPTSLYKPKLRTSDLVKIDLNGRVKEGSLKPSKEWPFHTAIYKKRSDVNAVVHAHSPMATGLALAGVKIKPLTLEAALVVADVPILPLKYPSTKELADLVGENIVNNQVLILQNHGVVGVGRDLAEATSAVEILEECATLTFVASHFGKPAELPQRDIDQIRKIYKT